MKKKYFEFELSRRFLHILQNLENFQGMDFYSRQRKVKVKKYE